MVKIRGGYLFLVLLFSISFISATIEITQPFETYNYGDEIYTTVTLNPSSVSGNFEINLICSNNKSANTYRISPASGAFSAGQIQKINHKIILTKEFIGNLSGDCYLEAFLGNEIVNSNHFLLTNDITLNVKTNLPSYNPSETLVWTMDAVKANTRPLNGAVEVSGSQTYNGAVSDGKSTGSFTLASNLKAGKYELLFFVYDSDSNGILNQKSVSVYYNVNQVPTGLNIALSSLEALPGNSFSFSADLVDQSGEKINGTLEAVYVSPSGYKSSLNVESGRMASIDFSGNAEPGSYSLIVSHGKIEASKEFIVKESPNASVSFLEGSSVVIVKNTGNVPYYDNLSLTIGNEIKTIFVELELGQEKRYNLGAPDGLYDVIASLGGMNIQKQLSLTGRAISVNDSNGLAVFELYPIVWIFIVVILILAGLFVFFKFRNRKTYNAVQRSEKRVAIAERQKKEKHEELEEVSKRIHDKKQFLDLAKPLIDEAQSVLTTKGTKSYASFIALNVKNYASLNGHAINEINEAISDAKSKSGVIEHKGNHILIIFSPLITKTVGDNEVLAVKCAWKIKQRLDAYNKKFTGKIDYNMGINVGQVIAALVGGKLNYTSLGNGVLLARRMSDLGNGKILVSAGIRSKLMRQLKVNKISHTIGNVDIFDVYNISDIESNQEKLRELLKRTSFS